MEMRPPKYIGVLVHVNEATIREHGKAVVFYHTIDGKDDTRESIWTAHPSSVNHPLISKLQTGKDYHVKLAVSGEDTFFMCAREVVFGKVLQGVRV